MAWKITPEELLPHVREFCEAHVPKHIRFGVIQVADRVDVEFSIQEHGWGTGCNGRYDWKHKCSVINWSCTERTVSMALASIVAYRDITEFAAKLDGFIEQFEVVKSKKKAAAG